MRSRWSVRLVVARVALVLSAGIALAAVEGRADSRLASVVDAPAPQWVLSIEPGTWASISRNTLADVNPAADPAANPDYPAAAPWHGNSGQKSVVTAWNGGAFASRFGKLGSLIAFGGGHNDYFGNEVYAFDLEQRRWSRVTNPYAAPRDVLTARYDGGAFPDGSPLPPHTYDYVDYHPASNSFVLLKGLQQLGVSGGAISGAPAFLYDFGSRTWRRSPPAAAAYGSSGWSAYDALRDVFWVNPPGATPQAGFRHLDPDGTNPDGSVGSWSESFGPRKSGGGDGMGAYDPSNDILVYTDFKKPPGAAYGVNLARPGDAPVELKLEGSAPELGAGHGWEWSDLRQALIYWPRSAGAEIHELRLRGTNWRDGPWVWTRLTRGTNSVVPEPMTADNGVYGRFRLVRFADAEIAIVVNRVDGPVYAFRIPDAGLPRPSAPKVRVLD